ncbi:outer membrane protein assembly factor BamB family protein [Wenyingzhuangia aestuarii]|uniref:outer membrane protein assembly factor BamB family protein n=1 Tax=Wenyingzhuangia aestuarii TaxID=1647582 RepID=UPI00143A9757|nr:PQQ-binding-like beta-propeller repeat protein [Wenyingzhuangia aestuarii]NJB83672.1 WD40 repeat protein [Wenyingzhuangia aestuarii]
MKKIACLLLVFLGLQNINANSGIKSIETDYTIMKVRVMQYKNTTKIIGTSYEGTVVCYDYSGKLQWKNELSGFMNNDIYCADIDNDGKDEILAPNADGTLYCLDDNGKLLWKFKQNSAPILSATMVTKGKTNYVVCGGFDKNIHYLSTKGKLLKSIPSVSYGIEKKHKNHAINYLRKIQQNGKDVLVVLSAFNTNYDKGVLYYFKPFEDQPYQFTKMKGKGGGGSCPGTFSVNDIIPGNTEILLGGNGLNTLQVSVASVEKCAAGQLQFKFKNARKDIGKVGYRLASAEAIPYKKSFKYYVLYGNRMHLVSPEKNGDPTEIIESNYAFNDMCKDGDSEKLILASAQSGGSCIHVIDYSSNAWKKDFQQLQPAGKMAKILTNTSDFRKKLKKFKIPKWEEHKVAVKVLVSGLSDEEASNLRGENAKNFININSVKKLYPHVENWDRSGMDNKVARETKDHRKKYDLTSDQVVQKFKTELSKSEHGVQYWQGHGRDIFFYSLPTMKKVIEEAGDKIVIPILAEMGATDKDAIWSAKNFMYPLAELLKGTNSFISVRNKFNFWQCEVYTPAYKGLVSGKYADAFVSSMEESNSKVMDMSFSGRIGLWAAGSMNQWGTRFTRDNVCYDRLRQLSYQKVPNHALRMFVHRIASGASVVHNTSVNVEYQRVLWEMIAKGILYVPTKKEIVSFSPVHLSMLDPNPLFLAGSGVKDVTIYDAKFEKENPMIVGKTKGVYSAAPVNEWDFSKYTSNTKERRLEYLPNYSRGLVLTTPPNDKNSKRGTLESNLNPIYKNNTTEFFMDGKNYYSDVNKSKTYAADTYYKTIKKAIDEGAKKLPLTVEGRVAWVTAHTAPKHLRLTIVDGGYVNPNDRVATVKFHTAKVKKITNLLTNEEVKFSSAVATINVPCGLFVFLDIELETAL